MLRYITSCLLGVTVAPSGVVEAGGGGWKSFEGGRSKARGQVNGSRGTRPDNGVLCEDGKFDGESLSSPSDGRPTALLYLKGVGGGRRGLGPPGARSGVKLPLRVAQEQTEIFCGLCWRRGSCVAKLVPTSPGPGAPYGPCPVVKTLGRGRRRPVRPPTLTPDP